MTLGDYGLKSALLVVEKMTMKSNTDAVKEFYADDGAGLVLATAALSAVTKVVMANEDHDYSEETDHDISVTVVGLVECAKVAGSGLARKGDKIMIRNSRRMHQIRCGRCYCYSQQVPVEAANLVNLGKSEQPTKPQPTQIPHRRCG